LQQAKVGEGAVSPSPTAFFWRKAPALEKCELAEKAGIENGTALKKVSGKGFEYGQMEL